MIMRTTVASRSTANGQPDAEHLDYHVVAEDERLPKALIMMSAAAVMTQRTRSAR